MKVSKRLGHANAKITLEIYAHLIPNEDNETADIFEKARKCCYINVCVPTKIMVPTSLEPATPTLSRREH